MSQARTPAAWNAMSEYVAFDANLFKFQGNPTLKNSLMGTVNAQLVMAQNNKDAHWGAGITFEDCSKGKPLTEQDGGNPDGSQRSFRPFESLNEPRSISIEAYLVIKDMHPYPAFSFPTLMLEC